MRTPRISIRRMLAGCAVAFCVVSLWIRIAFPGRALELWFYFAYMTVACTFVPLPTPQAAMDYGQRFSPMLAAIVGGIGSCISGLIDYTLVTAVFRYEKIARIKRTRTYISVERLFKRAPFVVLVIAAFTPIPFEPVKLLACATRYNRIKFVLAIFVGRAPRYYFLAKLQKDLLRIPGPYLWGSIVALVVIEAIRRLVKRLRQKG
jgi:membrane protein YqaA with SNARE-associated domain